MVTPGGYTMSVAMTNCGHLGGRPIGKVISIRPLIRKQINLARHAAEFSSFMSTCGYGSGYPDFQPDACLINRYVPGAKLRCIRIKTNRICARQLFLFLWLTRDFSIWRPETK